VNGTVVELSQPMRAVAHVPEPEEQLAFDGMPVKELCFSLKSVSRLYCVERFGIGQHVTGTYEGRIKAFYYDDGGKLVQLVEVLDAEVGG